MPRPDQPLERRPARGRGHLPPPGDRCGRRVAAGRRIPRGPGSRPRRGADRRLADPAARTRPLRGRLRLDPVRRRGQTRAASASSSGPRRPSARAAPPPPGSRLPPREGSDAKASGPASSAARPTASWASAAICSGGPDARVLRAGRGATRLMRAQITTVISDFGGVLTTPLIQSFAAVQDQTGVPFDALANAMAKIQEEDGRHPLFELETGQTHRGRLPAPPRRRSRAGPGPQAGAPPLPRDLLRRPRSRTSR